LPDRRYAVILWRKSGSKPKPFPTRLAAKQDVPEEMMGLKIMIVDDTMFMRQVLRGIVEEEEGWTVIGEAVNGEDAVRKYQECLPDITTMDIVMPLKSGIEALCEIIAFDSKAKVVMCTALGQEGLVKEARKAGAQGYILKPFDPLKVKEVIRKVAGV
jgi:two-component system chemotaxis response regulator CheY